MEIDDYLWLKDIIDKLAVKHNVETWEVEEVFANNPRFRLRERGNRAEEDVYIALGRTDAGRYLFVVFVYKPRNQYRSQNLALVTSAETWRKRKEINMSASNTIHKPAAVLSLEEEAREDLLYFADTIEYLETHDIGDELEEMPEVHFTLSPQLRRKRYSLDHELAAKLDSIASQRGTSAETLLNEWVREKTAEVEAVGAAN